MFYNSCYTDYFLMLVVDLVMFKWHYLWDLQFLCVDVSILTLTFITVEVTIFGSCKLCKDVGHFVASTELNAPTYS